VGWFFLITQILQRGPTKKSFLVFGIAYQNFFRKTTTTSPLHHVGVHGESTYTLTMQGLWQLIVGTSTT
jgi:hypothetical protein